MTLLACAGLFTKSLLNVSRVDLGIKVDNVVTFGISPELNAYKSERSRQLFERLEEELAALPGVTGVTTALVPLLAGSNWGSDVQVEGFQSGPDIDSNSRFNEVGAGYFRTMGVPLIAGREFTRADVLGSPKVTIVNEAFAKKFNLGRNAVGKRIGSGRTGEAHGHRDRRPGAERQVQRGQARGPAALLPAVPAGRRGRNDDVLRAHRRSTRRRFSSTSRRSWQSSTPICRSRICARSTQQVRNNVFLDRLMTTLSAAFAVLATLLAAVGLYGVLAYTVTQRTREIGLRMALGAAPSRVRVMVLRQVAIMTVIGGVIGLTAAVAAGRGAQSLLYQLQGSDPLVLAASAIVLTLVALGAGLIPAHRASRLDPMRALRYE